MRRRSDGAVRAECRRLLRDLAVTPPLEVPDLAERLGAHLGRPILLVPWPLERFGMSFPCTAGDGRSSYVVAYRGATARWHQEHIICHELGHIVCGDLDDEEALDQVGEDDVDYRDAVEISNRMRSPGVPRRLRRSCFVSARERRVEIIATTLMEWAVVPGCAPHQDPAGAAASVGKLYESLSFRRGWR